jgi:hypothetical protein
MCKTYIQDNSGGPAKLCVYINQVILNIGPIHKGYEVWKKDKAAPEIRSFNKKCHNNFNVKLK